ncbi:hypothetical protein AR158_c589L [Paramecium bursaria Chlorella virus AR158]|uniref:hypothetical protein n=1 Tax=Paramecium bursaria Chlorella virus AR158 TaxID=380598 RepID=UPI00015AA79B|nr:hypothetical protein AR158_c589L [Paramecium bursaria Chlorella virus AR158]ABU44134.1 hypothetical protein AR158_c589L [Paramecium bursaria Chlorella virus AR158]
MTMNFHGRQYFHIADEHGCNEFWKILILVRDGDSLSIDQRLIPQRNFLQFTLKISREFPKTCILLSGSVHSVHDVDDEWCHYVGDLVNVLILRCYEKLTEFLCRGHYIL